MQQIETDYLVVGAGAAGLAFTDELIARTDADVVMVDRRTAPGGHWNDAYPFVRLHQPSAFYGVNSRVLGTDSIDTEGPNAGFYERATAAEICEYFRAVLDEHLLASGQVRFLGGHEYDGTGGTHRVRALGDGQGAQVVVRRKLVDATYLETPIPKTHTPPFTVAPDVAFVPVNDIVDLDRDYERYVLIGAGKTSMDACTWLLEHGVAPERIRWIRPRDAWIQTRAGFQPLAEVASIMEAISLDVEAVAGAASVDDVFARLEARGRLLRIDPDVWPTMYRCAIIDERELAQLRRVTDVVRLGRVRALEPDRIVLEHGEVPSGPGTLHVDCTAAGLRVAPGRPIFAPDRIVLQQVRYCSPTFNAALVAFIEATRDDLNEQNRLCPPNPYPDAAADWIPNFHVTLQAADAWLAEPDLAAWMEGARLNLLRGMGDHMGEPRMQAALQRYLEHQRPAIARMQELLAQPVG